MRRAERPSRHERLADRQHARHGVDLRGLECLVETHLREDGGEPPGEHRLAAARRTWFPLSKLLAGSCRRVSVPTRPFLSSVIPSTQYNSSSRATGVGTFLITAGKSAAS